VKRYEMASKRRYIEPDEWFMEERMDGRWVKWDDFESWRNDLLARIDEILSILENGGEVQGE